MAKKKPSPINTKLARKPVAKKAAAPAEAPAAFNDVSSITAKQMARAERAIDNLRVEVKDLRKTPPKIQVSSPNPKVEVTLPDRPRIGKIKIVYDQLGFPSELIPQYVDPAV